MKFEHDEDAQFFAGLLSNGKVDELYRNFFYLFDFCSVGIKRKEFRKQYKNLYAILNDRDKGTCQLSLPGCLIDKELQIDHKIPLSSNVLNKKLRQTKALQHKKVKTQSIGSNDIQNLILACRMCNGNKKHRIYDFVMKKFLL